MECITSHWCNDTTWSKISNEWKGNRKELTCRGSGFSWQRRCAGRPRGSVRGQTSALLTATGGSAAGTACYPGAGQPGSSGPPTTCWGTSGPATKTSWLDLTLMYLYKNRVLLALNAAVCLCRSCTSDYWAVQCDMAVILSRMHLTPSLSAVNHQSVQTKEYFSKVVQILWRTDGSLIQIQ